MSTDLISARMHAFTIVSNGLTSLLSVINLHTAQWSLILRTKSCKCLNKKKCITESHHANEIKCSFNLVSWCFYSLLTFRNYIIPSTSIQMVTKHIKISIFSIVYNNRRFHVKFVNNKKMKMYFLSMKLHRHLLCNTIFL